MKKYPVILMLQNKACDGMQNNRLQPFYKNQKNFMANLELKSFAIVNSNDTSR